MGKIRRGTFGERMSGRVYVALAALLVAAHHPPMSNADTAAEGPVQAVPGSARGGAAPEPPAMTTPPVPILLAPKLPKSFVYDPEFVAGLEKALFQTDLQPAHVELKNALTEAKTAINVTAQLSSYQATAWNCLQKSFSEEDQKQAGCTGTDSVNQCSDKLFWYCLKSHHGFPAAKTKAVASLEHLEKAMKEYRNKLQSIPTK